MNVIAFVLIFLFFGLFLILYIFCKKMFWNKVIVQVKKL